MSCNLLSSPRSWYWTLKIPAWREELRIICLLEAASFILRVKCCISLNIAANLVSTRLSIGDSEFEVLYGESQALASGEVLG